VGRHSSKLLSLKGHKDYYYNVFENIADPFEEALKARKEEESNALAIRAFAGDVHIALGFILNHNFFTVYSL
jgi:hypothetical protein